MPRAQSLGSVYGRGRVHFLGPGRRAPSLESVGGQARTGPTRRSSQPGPLRRSWAWKVRVWEESGPVIRYVLSPAGLRQWCREDRPYERGQVHGLEVDTRAERLVCLPHRSAGPFVLPPDLSVRPLVLVSHTRTVQSDLRRPYQYGLRDRCIVSCS